MFRNSENCDPNRVKGSFPYSKPHFVRRDNGLTFGVSADSLMISANRESNYWVSRKSVGISIKVCNTEKEEFLIHNTSEICTKEFYFSIERFGQGI